MASLNDFLKITERDGISMITCSRCEHELGPADQNPNLNALMHEGPVQEAGPHVNPYHLHGDKFVFRQFYCPGCLALINTEVAQRGEPPLWDVQLEA